MANKYKVIIHHPVRYDTRGNDVVGIISPAWGEECEIELVNNYGAMYEDMIKDAKFLKEVVEPNLKILKETYRSKPITVLETPDRLEDNKPGDNIICDVFRNGESLVNFKKEVNTVDMSWHDVKAELPPSSQHIIIQTSDCDISQYGFFWINEKKFTKSWEDEKPIPNVVAWMYMPETSDKFFKMPQCNG